MTIDPDDTIEELAEKYEAVLDIDEVAEDFIMDAGEFLSGGGYVASDILCDLIEDDDYLREQLKPTFRSNEQIHIDIEEVMDRLDDALDNARGGSSGKYSYGGEREDFMDLMSVIDEISSMSHHGGPVLQYASEEEAGLSQYTDWEQHPMNEMLNRKMLPGFLEFAAANDVLTPSDIAAGIKSEQERARKVGPMNYFEDLQSKAKGDPLAMEALHSSDQYYQHPYFSDRARWMDPKLQQSPLYMRHMDPSASGRAGAELAIQSAESGLQGTNDWSDETQRLRGLKSWGEGWLQRNPRASIIERMTRISARADESGNHDIADALDKIVDKLRTSE